MVPAVLFGFVQRGAEITNIVVIGYTNDTAQLAGVGMGTMIATVIANSAQMGFSVVLDTLQSQAAGAGNFELCGIYLHRARLVLCIISVPIFIVLLNCGPILLLCGQDAKVVDYCCKYILVYLPGIFLAGLADIQRKFLTNFGMAQIAFHSGLLGLVIHILNCYILVIRMELGITGLGIAMALTQLIIFFTLLIYTHMQEDLREARVPMDMRAAQDLGMYFKIGLPSYIMFALDEWVWEFMVVISGILGVSQQAATVVLMNLVALLYRIAVGFEAASTTLVGSQIGKGGLFKARQFFRTFCYLTSIAMVLSCLTIYFFRR